MCFLHKPLISTVFGVCGGLFVSKKRTLQTKQREIFSFPMHKINTRFSFKFLFSTPYQDPQEVVPAARKCNLALLVTPLFLLSPSFYATPLGRLLLQVGTLR